MDSILLLPIVLPTIAGFACLVLPKRLKLMRELLALVSTVITVVAAAYILTIKNLQFTVFWLALGSDLTVQFDLLAGHFGSFVLLAVSIFALLVTLYSLRYMADHARHAEHYAYLLLTLGMAAGAALANNLLVFLLFWDLLALLLYAMVSLGGEEAMPGANKTLIIIGAADLALLLGIAFVWLASGTLSMSELTATPQILAGWLPTAAFLLIMVGAFAKAGAMPLHSWIPTISETAPIPTMAFLPAALDKLLGIYLLARISLHLFVITPGIELLLMAVGAITIAGAALMALIQDDYRKMLGFQTVAQVGYMVLGLGTGTFVGVIGGLLHMLNHATYKCCLFLCGGSVERQTGRTKFSALGGLAGAMPWTFVACLVASLASSGVPPFNAFVSKWLIYQGILDRGGALLPLFLLVAMFGSGLTMAAFMKLLYSMFWGDQPRELEQVTESNWTLLVPMIVLAFFCLAFGIFYLWPLNVFIRPILGEAGAQAVIPGIWQSGLATVLLILSLVAGFLFYLGGRARGAVETEVFLGGEALDPEVYRVPGTQFYGPIKGFAGLKQLYERGERGAFDLYRYMVGGITWGARVLYQYIDQALSDLYRDVLPALLDLIGQILRLFNTRLLLTYALWVAYVAGIVLTLWLPGGRLPSFGWAASPSGELLLNATRTLAIVGMLGWGLLALVETDLRRFLVFAASSQFGFVLLGATISWTAALAYLVSAGVAFVVIFLCCGSISRTLRTSEIEAMDGLSGRMPGRFLVFLIAALWLSGLPPFGSFFSKYLLGVAAHEVNLFFSLVITTAAILTLGYFLRPLRRFLHTAD